MKSKSSWSVFSVLLALAVAVAPAHAKEQISSPRKAAGAKSAVIAMMDACNKEFPAIVSGKTADDIDAWAESSETGAGSAVFKKSLCYRTHEEWEKTAQKNEWALGAPQERLPANAH